MESLLKTMPLPKVYTHVLTDTRMLCGHCGLFVFQHHFNEMTISLVMGS